METDEVWFLLSPTAMLYKGTETEPNFISLKPAQQISLPFSGKKMDAKYFDRIAVHSVFPRIISIGSGGENWFTGVRNRQFTTEITPEKTPTTMAKAHG